MSDWEQERRRHQERDDAFMARLRAEHRHELRVTIVAGLVGILLTAGLILGASAVWDPTDELTLILSVVGVVVTLGCIWTAHLLDERRAGQ